MAATRRGCFVLIFIIISVILLQKYVANCDFTVLAWAKGKRQRDQPDETRIVTRYRLVIYP